MGSWYNSLRNSWPLRRLGLADSCEVKEELVIKPSCQFTAVLEPWESYMITTQSLLIWEKPNRSAFALLLINVIFCLLVWSEPKVYFVASSAGLVIFLHQQWVHCIWPEIRVPLKPGERPPHYTDEWLCLNPSVLSAPEVGALLERWWGSIQGAVDASLHVRQHRPALFCLGSSASFTLLLLAGQLLSGPTIMYMGLMTCLLGPGAGRFVLPQLKQSVAQLWTNVSTTCANKLAFAQRASQDSDGDHSPDDLSEFLPECGTEEAEAALAAPLLSTDMLPKELVNYNEFGADYEPNARRRVPAASTQHQQQSGYFSSSAALGSPYNSLTPHIPTHGQLPGVSDSSDDEEDQEFMEGLVFDSLRREQSSLGTTGDLTRYAELCYNQDASSSVGRDCIDNKHQEQWSMDVSPATAVQTLASTLLQYPSAGSEVAGALLTSFGQSVLSSVVNSTLAAAAATNSVAEKSLPRATITDVTDSNDDYSSDPTRPPPPPPAAVVTSQQSSVVRARRTRAAAAARRVVKRQVNYQIDEATSDSDDPERSEDFEFISDDEFSD